MAFAHVAVGLLALGLAPRLWKALNDETLPARLARRCAATWLGVAAILGALIVGAPDYARELLGREWGLAEPLQFVLYLAGAGASFAHAARLGRASPSHGLYRAGGVLAVVLALEEVDYLGALSLVARLAGLERGRIGRQHVGGVHDLLNVLVEHPAWWVPAALAGAVLAAGLMWARRASLRALAAELAAPEGLLLVPGAALMTLAQVVDVADEAAGIVRATGWLTGRLVEEPCELLAILAVDGWLAVRYRRGAEAVRR